MNESKFDIKEEKIILNLLECLDGMESRISNEILQKTIMLVTALNSPVNIKRIRKVWFPEIDLENKRKAMLDIRLYGHNHICVANNWQIHIYSRKVWYSVLFPNQCLYYRLAKDRSIYLRKLTKANLIMDFRITPFEGVLKSFLKDNSPYKKNHGTNGFMLLQVLDEIRMFNNQ